MNQPYFTEGLFLGPTHLRLISDGLEQSIVNQLQCRIPFHWGFSTLEFDTALLSQGLLGLSRVSACFQDGTCYIANDPQTLPPPIQIPDGTQGRVMYLSIVRAQRDGRDVSEHAGLPSNATRYSTHNIGIYDPRLNETTDVEMMRLKVSLTLERGQHTSTLPIALVSDCTHGQVILDEAFVPPLLSWNVHRRLSQTIRDIAARVSRRASEFLQYAATRQPNSSEAQLAHLTLLGLNTHAAVNAHLASIPIHPEAVYRQWLMLASTLATFCKPRKEVSFPMYDHDNLQASFFDLATELYQLLANVNPSAGAMMIELASSGTNSYNAVIENPAILRSSRFVLLVNAAMPSTELIPAIQNQLKIASPATITATVRLNLSGATLSHLPNPPSEIPAYAGYSAFAIDQASESWRTICHSNALSLALQNDLPGCTFELWAIPQQEAP